MNKKKIIFFEPEMTGGKGHHLDNLIESSIYFEKNHEIIWFVNNRFISSNLWLPNFVKNFRIIDSYKSKSFLRKIMKILIEILNFFILAVLFFKKKKLKKYFLSFFENYFSTPEYFFNFYKYYKKLKINPNDIIIIQSCRPKDVELINFLLSIEEIIPKIVIRILYPPKRKKKKNFYYFIERMLKNPSMKDKLYLFTEVDSVKNIITNNSDLKVKNFTQIYCFHERKNPSSINVGFLGESRENKGFNKIPDLIEILKKINKNIAFTIQFSKETYPNTKNAKNRILELAKQYSDIDIFEGYLDFQFYRNLLRKINIMPILYDSDQVNHVGSGLFFSCITHEIPMIIPREASQLKSYLISNSYRDASTIKEYADEIVYIYNNYEKILKEMKIVSTNYKLKIKKDSLVAQIYS